MVAIGYSRPIGHIFSYVLTFFLLGRLAYFNLSFQCDTVFRSAHATTLIKVCIKITNFKHINKCITAQNFIKYIGLSPLIGVVFKLDLKKKD